MKTELGCMTFRSANVIELAEAAGGAGFDYITVRPMALEGAPLDGWSLRRRIEDCGVGVSIVEGLSSIMPGMGPDSSPPIEDFIRMAHRLGAPRIATVHYLGGPQTFEAASEAFGEACRVLAPEGLELVVEFVPDMAIPDLATALALVRHAGASNGAVMFDSLHFARSGGRLEELDADAAALIRACSSATGRPTRIGRRTGQVCERSRGRAYCPSRR